MAKYRGPRAKISRTFGAPILGCEKVLKKKNYPPGQHGRGRKRRTAYGTQLSEKKKLQYTYNIRAKELGNLVKKAHAKPGLTGDLLMQLLDLRLDNTVYRLGISPTNAAGRQLVVHRHICVNGVRVDRPSYLLKKGDVISLTRKAKQLSVIKNSLSANENAFSWLAWNSEKMEGEVLDIPARKSIPGNIDEKMIIAFFSR
ncbi:MAG: 30S ribosomal protein S4 [Bacteroidota bacterium]